MSKRIFRIMAVIGLYAVLSALTAFAQQSGEIVFDVPFEFVVSGQTLPAGKYSVHRISAQHPHLLQISSIDRRANAIVYTMMRTLNDRSLANELVFRKYGQRRFLSQIRSLSGSLRHDLPTSRAEKELREQARADKGRLVSDASPRATETVIVSATK